MLLSIIMIVKNEELYLRRCLDALQPLKAQVACELIIADTGSTDTTVAIAGEYADQVFFFQWCDDFSAARNATLQRATGNWIMVIDADEIIEDTVELVYFFTSGEYARFCAATVIQRNFNIIGQQNYRDYNMLRLAKRTDALHFENAIHESFTPVDGPICMLPTVEMHYGYVLDGRDEYIRNKTLLYTKIIAEELKKNPSNPSLYYYLYKAFSMYDAYDEAVECLTTGLGFAIDQNHIMQFDLFSQLATTYCQMGQYDHALKVIEDYFSLRVKPLAFDLDMYWLRGHIFFSLSQYKEAAKALNAYLKFLGDYVNNQHPGPEMLIYSDDHTNDYAVMEAVLMLARSYMNLSDLTTAGKVLHLAPDALWQTNEEHFKEKAALEKEITRALSGETTS